MPKRCGIPARSRQLRGRWSLSSVRRTVPVKEVRKDGRLGERKSELRVVGTTPDWFDLVARMLIAGRTLSWRDLENRAGVCVLTEHGARALLATVAEITELPVDAGGLIDPKTPAGAKIADDVADMIVGGVDLELHHRLEDPGTTLGHRLQEAVTSGGLEGHIR